MTQFLSCTIRMQPVPSPVLFFVIVVLLFPYGTPALALFRTEEEYEMNGVVELRLGTEDLVKWGGYGEEKLSVVTITGRVVCGGEVDHPCYVLPEDQTAQLSSTIPVSGATVAIFCGTKESRNSWVRATTDEYGDFSVELPSHLHAIPNLEKVCFANLLHLPENSPCSRQQITRKQMIKGIKLLSVEDGVRVYEADTMHLEPRSAKAC